MKARMSCGPVILGVLPLLTPDIDPPLSRERINLEREPMKPDHLLSSVMATDTPVVPPKRVADPHSFDPAPIGGLLVYRIEAIIGRLRETDMCCT